MDITFALNPPCNEWEEDYSFDEDYIPTIRGSSNLFARRHITWGDIDAFLRSRDYSRSKIRKGGL
jgi:hypothetical protein